MTRQLKANLVEKIGGDGWKQQGLFVNVWAVGRL